MRHFIHKTALVCAALLLVGCTQQADQTGQAASSSSFDEGLLKPEVLSMNTPREVEPYADPAVLKNLAPIRARFDNLAVTQPADTINPRMISFAEQMPKTIYEPVKDKAFLMAGWQLTSTLVVVGNDGLIVVDPGENDAASKQIMADFRKTTGIELPVTAVIYSHRHPDHSFGSAGLGVTQEDVDSGKVRIFAHHQFMEYLANDASVVGEILTVRTAYGGALYLGQNAKGFVHIGLGPTFAAGQISFYAPTDIVKGELEVEVSGIKMTLFEAYGDAEDEIDIYFPDLRHVHGSETIQGETFPNLYTLRGTKYRDVVNWYKGVDKLLAYAEQSDSYSHSHMRSWVGTEFITERIRNYRDAIQYVHDQSVRHMNKGATREELVDLISLPDKLANDPWLQEFYGSVAHVVQNIYNGYLGWYSGDATELARPAYKRRAELYVSAMGGRDAVLAIARKAIAAKDYGWAMDITTHLVRADPSDKEARQAKADAMRAWGYEQANTYYRNFAITGAAELDGSLPTEGAWNFADPVIIRQLSVGTILENLRVKLDGKKAATGDVSIGFVISDLNEEHAFTVRNGVAVYETKVPSDANVVVTLPSSVVYDFVLGKGTLRDAVENGTAKVKGDAEAIYTFASYFDFKPTVIKVSGR
jgi:alkyl sulfatase BDS1-like metallo-beta-lactamase superfamily hydrolase